MNRKSTFATVVLLLLVFLTLPFLAQQDDDSFRLLIQRFDKDTVLSISDKNLEIVPSLQVSFTRYDELRLLNRQDFEELMEGSLIGREGLDTLTRMDAIVFGNYVVEGNYLKIEPIIYDVHSGLFHRLSYSRGTVSGLETLVDEVADDVYDHLVEISPKLQGTAKKVVIVSDYDKVSGEYDHRFMRTEAERNTAKVIQSLDYHGFNNIQIVPWSEIKEYDDITRAELINKLNPDMYMKLTFMFDNNALSGLKTEFNILEKSRDQIQKRDFELPDLSSSYYSKDYDFIDFVINELSSFFDAVIDDNGQWKISPFPNKTATKSSSPEMAIEKAKNALLLNRYYLSDYYYYDALNRFSDQLDPVNLRLQIGFNKIYLNRLEEALEEFKWVISSNQEIAYAYLGISVIDFFDADYKGALEQLDLAREKGLENLFYYDILKGYYLFELEKYNEALASFHSGLSRNREDLKIKVMNYLGDVSIRIYMGLSLLELKRYDEAIAHYKTLVKEYPYDTDLPYYLGDAYSKRGIEAYFAGNYDQAISDFTESRKSYINTNINFFMRTAYIYEKRYDDAEAFIRNEIKEGRYDEMSIWRLHALDLRERFVDSYTSSNGESPDKELGNQAIRTLEINAEYNPADPMSYYYMGDIQILMGDIATGMENMEKAFAIEEVNFDIQTGLLYAYLLNNRYDDFDRTERSLSRLNRKFVVPDRTQAINYYLKVTAELARDKKAKRELRDLEKLLDDGVIIDNWIYKPYENWLASCDCPESSRKELLKLTERMKEHDLQ
ncbi:MAG: tetratricopeptide repeat protein [bacterium]